LYNIHWLCLYIYVFINIGVKKGALVLLASNGVLSILSFVSVKIISLTSMRFTFFLFQVLATGSFLSMFFVTNLNPGNLWIIFIAFCGFLFCYLFFPF
jgi:hypothetical protein